MLAMEQELVRAHQRATKQCSPISVFAVLLERLLSKMEWSSEERPGGVERGGEDKRCGYCIGLFTLVSHQCSGLLLVPILLLVCFGAERHVM